MPDGRPPNRTMSSFTDTCEGDACWAAGWLQHSLTICASITSDAVETARLEGPLTSHMSPDSFPTRVVPFDITVLSILFILMMTLLCHEIYAAFRKPLLANHEEAKSNWMQVSYLASWFNMFFVIAMTVPVSLDFCMQMGQSATMSGFFLSSPIIGSIVGIVVGKIICGEADWNQLFARRMMVWCGQFSFLCTLVTAFLLNHSVHLSLSQRRTTFWFIILLLQVSTLVSAMPTVPMLVMQNKVTPTSEKTFWMIMAQCFRNAGMLVGPGFFALTAWAVKRGQPVAPTSLMAWCYLGFLLFGECLAIYSSMVLPKVLVPLPEEPSAPETEVCVTMLPSTQRERVVKNMVWYALERPFSISAIEVSTIMLLEVSYGWSTELCGTAFTVVAGASLIFSAISSVLLSRKFLTESSVFFGANLAGLFGVIFLFDFGTGAAGLLLADGMVYGMASVANGIAEGWASNAAMPGTNFSLEIYRLQNTIAVNCARFVSPIVARTVLDFGGRNIYACLQLLIVFLGTATVYKTVKMVWDNKGEDEKQTPVLKKEEAMQDAN